MRTFKTPTIEQVVADPAASYWLKAALESALKRDCLDAAYDAKLLAELLKARCDKIMGMTKTA